MQKFSLLFVLALAGCSFIKTTGPSGPAADGGGGGGSGDVRVPDLIGKTADEAAALVAEAGFTGAVESSRPVECEDAPQLEGLINCQDPPAGSVVKKYVTVQINVYRPTRIGGAVVRDQLLALLGKRFDDAKALLASYGHDGPVSMDYLHERDEDCGDELVCSFDVAEAGIGIHDRIVLFVNPPLD